jgi:hypothetical protein
MRGALLALALAGMGLGGCETFINGADGAANDDARCINEWGTSKGSEAYVQCRAVLSQRRADSERQVNENLRAIMANPAGQSVPTGGGMMCMKQGERVSGFNRICNYSCSGSAYAMTVPSSQLCPLNVRR